MTDYNKYIIPVKWIPTISDEPCPQCEQAKTEAELDLAGALHAMDDFERSMLTIQTSAGITAEELASLSEGILKLAEEEQS